MGRGRGKQYRLESFWGPEGGLLTVPREGGGSCHRKSPVLASPKDGVLLSQGVIFIKAAIRGSGFIRELEGRSPGSWVRGWSTVGVGDTP